MNYTISDQKQIYLVFKGTGNLEQNKTKQNKKYWETSEGTTVNFKIVTVHSMAKNPGTFYLNIKD